jgi:hypothetical protein
MSFEIDRFFSPELDRLRKAVRSRAPFNLWFDYAASSPHERSDMRG